MDQKGKWIQEGGKWIWVKNEELAYHVAANDDTHYESPTYLEKIELPGEPIKPKPKPAAVPMYPPDPAPPLVGRYQSPSYLNAVPIVPEPPKPVKVPEKPTPPQAGKLGSIAPNSYPHKTGPSPSREIPKLTTCTLCSGPIRNGECTQCSAKQCQGCGEMNFAMSKTCYSCGRAL